MVPATISQLSAYFVYFLSVVRPPLFWLWEGSNYPSRPCNGPDGPKGPKLNQTRRQKQSACTLLSLIDRRLRRWPDSLSPSGSRLALRPGCRAEYIATHGNTAPARHGGWRLTRPKGLTGTTSVQAWAVSGMGHGLSQRTTPPWQRSWPAADRRCCAAYAEFSAGDTLMTGTQRQPPSQTMQDYTRNTEGAMYPENED